MKFWAVQRRHKLRTVVTLLFFFFLVTSVSFLVELIVRYLSIEGYIPYIPYSGFFLFGFICLISFIYYLSYAAFGGASVAESLGAYRLTRENCASSKEEELLNVVEEIAIASRLPIPAVYIIEADEINAFASGLSPKKSAVTVTSGALEAFTREELQGVIAHEFGHIANGDMRMGMKLAALLMGFFLIFYFGLRLLEGSFFLGRSNEGNGRRGNSALLIALVLLAAGALLWFAGAILRACVSREREYLADASSVEFTRNPHGIASALKKTEQRNEKVQDMPKSGLGYAHLYLDNRSFWCRLFATHPPIAKRIEAILGTKPKE